jgi:hypothetical protein
MLLYIHQFVSDRHAKFISFLLDIGKQTDRCGEPTDLNWISNLVVRKNCSNKPKIRSSKSKSKRKKLAHGAEDASYTCTSKTCTSYTCTSYTCTLGGGRTPPEITAGGTPPEIAIATSRCTIYTFNKIYRCTLTQTFEFVPWQGR